MNSLVQIDPVSTKARFTAAEFLEMCELGAFADMKVELVNGELERMTPPMNPHSEQQTNLTVLLAALVSVKRVRVEIGIVLDDDTVLACDIAVLRIPISGSRMLAPIDVALVIEVAETTVSRDLGMKRAKYVAAGIGEYWVVDGARSIVHVFAKPVEGEYAANRTVRFGEPLAVPGSDRTIIID